jgi:hypothetical protein
MNVCFIALAYFGRSFGSTLLMTTMIGTSYALLGIVKYWKKRPVLVVASSSYQNNNEQMSSTKVVSFKSDEVAMAEQ